MAAAMGGRRRLIIYEPFRSIFYAPQFVALHGGDFAAEALDVEVVTASAGVTTTAALMDGHSEIALGGIMRSLDVADRGGPFLVHFAEVNSRNGFFLLTRQPRSHFTWTDLVGTTLIDFAEAPTPWQCMLTVLRREGVDPARVRIERHRPLAEKVAAWRAGHGDFLETGQPIVEQLVEEGAAHLVVSMGDATGPLPFSSYMTTPARLRFLWKPDPHYAVRGLLLLPDALQRRVVVDRLRLTGEYDVQHIYWTAGGIVRRFPGRSRVDTMVAIPWPGHPRNIRERLWRVFRRLLWDRIVIWK